MRKVDEQYLPKDMDKSNVMSRMAEAAGGIIRVRVPLLSDYMSGKQRYKVTEEYRKNGEFIKFEEYTTTKKLNVGHTDTIENFTITVTEITEI